MGALNCGRQVVAAFVEVEHDLQLDGQADWLVGEFAQALDDAVLRGHVIDDSTGAERRRGGWSSRRAVERDTASTWPDGRDELLVAGVEHLHAHARRPRP